MAGTAVDDERDDIIDIEMYLLGLCGAREPTGRRCFRQAGHEGRCTFLAVSKRGPRIRHGSGEGVTRPHAGHQG